MRFALPVSVVAVALLAGCGSLLGLDDFESSGGPGGGTGQGTNASTGPGGPNGSTGSMTTSTMSTSGSGANQSTGAGNTGNIVWVQSYGGADDDTAWGVSVTDAGDIYLAGETITGTSTAISIGKLKPDGDPAWTRDFPIGGPNELYARVYGVVADETGVVFAGNVDEPGVTIDGQPAEGSFIAKLDTDGVLVWLQSCTGTLSYESQAYSGGIAFAPFSGNPRGAVVMSVPANSGITCGNVSSGVVGVRFNAETGAVLTSFNFDADGYERNARIDSTSDGGMVVSAWGFLRAFTSAGVEAWNRDFYTPTMNVAFDPDSGGAVLVGTTVADYDLDLGGGLFTAHGEGFLARYDGGGAFVNQLLFGPPATGTAVRVGSDGAVYLGAHFSAPTHFGDNVPFTVASAQDGALVKIDKDSNLIWKHQLIGGAGASVDVKGIALGGNRVIAFGQFTDGSLQVEQEMFTSNGRNDVFVVAIEP